MAKEILKKISRKEILSEAESFQLLESFIKKDSDVTDAQIGAYLMSTSLRSISSTELAGAAASLRKNANRIEFPNKKLLDTCGTGGSGLDSFNTSTAVALVLASCGQSVAKHGNRAATSRSGSADVLEALGINIQCSIEETTQCLLKHNFGFFFAPQHHPATKRVQIIRRELEVRTIFNFLGPLANPAGASFQLLGVSSHKMLPIIAEALAELEIERALVVRGHDGLDEITTSGETTVYEVNRKSITNYDISPKDFSIPTVAFKEISGKQPEDAALLIKEIFSGRQSAYSDLVALNAGAALYACKRSSSILKGVERARKELKSKNVLKTLEAIIKATN